MIKYVQWSSCKSTRYSCQISKELEFSQQIFDKYSNTKFNENPSSESRDVPYGQENRQAANSRFTQLYERA